MRVICYKFYSHVNYSVTKIIVEDPTRNILFYSHVNYSVTKISRNSIGWKFSFTVT